MGMESYAIADDAITASSFKVGSEPYHARVTSPKSWSPLDEDQSPYLEVNFESAKVITSILTQGGDNGEMVKSFSIQYVPKTAEEFVDLKKVVSIQNSDGSIEEEEIVAQLAGNRDDHTIRENILENPIHTSVIRIFPIREPSNQTLSLRVELRGCNDVTATTSVPYVVETTTETEVKTTQLPVEATTSLSVVETTTTEVSRSTPMQESTSSESIVVVSTTTTSEKINTTVAVEGKLLQFADFFLV